MKKVFRRTSLLLAAILMGSTSIQAQKSPQDMDRFIDALMKKMTVEENRRSICLGKMQALSNNTFSTTKNAASPHEGLTAFLFYLFAFV